MQRDEHLSLYAVVETHLRDLEEPPIDADWCWAGGNRIGTSRKGGGVGLLWRRELQWRFESGEHTDYLWGIGDIMGVPTALCVVYLSVGSSRVKENENLVACLRKDAQRWARDREVIVVGDFNGHISELDGYTDANGALLMQLADDLNLSIANLDPRCEGQVTWCARSSKTSIDYALVSPRLNSLLRCIHIDEEGAFSLGSDHNRLRLDFSHSNHRVKEHKTQTSSSGYLPPQAIETVAKEFEDSNERLEAETYAGYMAVLCSLMKPHMVQNKKSTCTRRNAWWDKEVADAWRARRQANRDHRQAVKTMDGDATAATWKRYLQLKQDMQTLVQVKLAEANRRLMKDMRDDGKSAAQKFWHYVRSLDRKADAAPQMTDASTGKQVENLGEHIAAHLSSLYGPPQIAPRNALETRQTGSGVPNPWEPKWEFSRRSIDRAIARIRAHTAAGPDGIPARLLRFLGPDSREQFASIFTGIINGEEIPDDWRKGRVALILKPGGKADNIQDYRSLTVTSVLYRIFTQVLKDWLAGWAESQRVFTELQNGFRRGRRLEDNIFTLTQCAEIARKEGRELLCCFLDVEKAYDNVPHCTLFARLAVLGLPPVLLAVIQRLYANNRVTARFGDIETKSVEVHKGLRQGCPLSPILYLLYASGLERRLLQSGIGFGLKYSTSGLDETCRLPGLVFADDLVLTAEHPEDLQALLDICAAEVADLGLRFNTRKSSVVQLAGSWPHKLKLTLCGETLNVSTTYKYLGVVLCAEDNLYESHETNLRRTALRAQCILRRRCLWGCNRYTMVRDLWKLVHVPGLTFANAVVCLSAETREWLERRQREVGRTAVGCHGSVANEAIQGDLGWSSFEAREATSKLSFRGRLLFMSRERWARRVFEYLSATCLRTKWVRRVYRIESKYNLFSHPIDAGTAAAYTKEVRSRVGDAEEAFWLAGLEGKATLSTYRQHKTAIGAVQLYDNSIGSQLLFEARAGALRTLVYRRRYDSAPEVLTALCRMCGYQEETIEHIVLQCPQLLPRPVEGATLPVALGFFNQSEEAGDDTAKRSSSVRVTKRRLTQWWTVVHSRVKATA